MSLATLGSKPRTITHRYGTTIVETAARRPHTREESLTAGRALTRHAVLGLLMAGSAVYGLIMALTFG
jgi:hypothetical protein